ncbi:MAG: hypothetical protein NC935_03780 [Candidatus Omnitrophica bacterium]|nr:hypothetical protein [Candidatus Omnitrophota bacterium]
MANVKKILFLAILVIGFYLTITKIAFALPYRPGETLNPRCRPAEANCTVKFFWSATSTGIYYLDGNVGIGIDNPQSKLDIDGKIRANDLFINSLATETGIYWQSKNANLRIYEDQDKPGWSLLRSDKNNKIGFVVDPDIIGLSIVRKILHGATQTAVGIGTNNPGEKLTVAGNVLVLPYGSWKQNGDTAKISMGDGFNYISSVFGKGLVLGSWDNITFKNHKNETVPGDGKELMTITSDGRVGIGINNPQADLHIERPNQPDSFQLGSSEALRIRAQNYFLDEGSSYDAVIIEKTDDDPIVEGGIVFGFSTSTDFDTPITSDKWAKGFQSVMTIRGTGNVGIGTEKPKWKLEVKGMVNASDDGISTKVIEGPITDQNFYGQPHNGLIGIDSKNGRIYFRANDKWHYVSKTGGFQIPVEEIEGINMEDFVIGKIDERMSDGALHGVWVSLAEALEKLGLTIKNGIAYFKELFVDKLTTKQLCSQSGKCIEVSDDLINKLIQDYSLPFNNYSPNLNNDNKPDINNGHDNIKSSNSSTVTNLVESNVSDSSDQEKGENNLGN